MQLSLLQENLNQALGHVSRFVATKSQLPILSNILFSTQNGRLLLSATNLEMGINYYLGAKIEQEGSITIPAKEITEFVSYLPAGKIDLELNSQNLILLKSTKTYSSFTTSPSVDFPKLPQIDPSQALDIETKLLVNTINQISFAAASDDSRPILTAILWQITSDGFTMVATDGFRLSLKKVNYPNDTSRPTATYLIPARSLNEVVKLSKNTKSIKAGPSTDGHQFLFTQDDVELSTRIIEGEFPAYDRIIPTVSPTVVTLDKEECLQAIKISSVFARESANVIKWKIGSDKIEFTSNAPQVGQNHVEVEAKVTGQPLEIAFNYRFVNDFLSVVKGDQITIECNQPLTPVIFKDLADPDFLHIIMPVRIQD